MLLSRGRSQLDQRAVPKVRRTRPPHHVVVVDTNTIVSVPDADSARLCPVPSPRPATLRAHFACSHAYNSQEERG